MSPDLPAHGRPSSRVRIPADERGLDVSREWAIGGATGHGVRVAIIDSGIEADHADLEGCVDRDGGVVVRVGTDGPSLERGDHPDLVGHGTACAGIVHQIAPEATLLSARVAEDGATAAEALVAALEWAVDEGVDIVNLSVGTTRREWALALHETCDRAYFAGTLVVTAAANVERTSYPSLFASVLSVASSLTTDPVVLHANPDPPTELLARGVDVPVPWLGGSRSVGTGNSYAAPHVAGLAALVRSKHPGMRPVQLKAVLWALAANVRPDGPEVAGRPTRLTRSVPGSDLS